MTTTISKPLTEWRPVNQAFLNDFREWLQEGGYSNTARKL